MTEKRGAVMGSGISSERGKLTEAARGGAWQFAESESLEPRREQAQRDKREPRQIRPGFVRDGFFLNRNIRSKGPKPLI